MIRILSAAAIAAVTVAGLTATPAFAKVETKAMLSKSCNPDKIKALSNGAVTEVKAGAAANIYNITLDTAKMSWQDLTTKMAQAGCFN